MGARPDINLRGIVAATHDTLMAGASFMLALYLRLGSEEFYLSRPYLLPGTLMFAAIALAVFIPMRLYRGLWRYASLPDMVALVKSVTLAIALFYGFALFTATRLEGIPRSAPFIQWLLLLALLGGPRFLYRALKDRTLHFDFRHDASKQIPLLLIGATGSAELFIRNTLRDSTSPYRAVGLLDDDPTRRNTLLHNVPIYGACNILRVVVNKLERKGLKPHRIILCDDQMDPAQVTALLEEAEALGLPMGRLPSMSEFRTGTGAQEPIRPIAIEDLLGRAQNSHNRASMQELVSGKRVAVTGAGGSIGAELCRQLATLAPASILLVEQSEHALYQIDLELKEAHPHLTRRAVLGDVRVAACIRKLFSEFKPQLVFHAAAIKHVPLAEENPLAAIETNVLGTRNVAEAAGDCGAEIMVLISTDKAVNPANVMGATKRLAESACQCAGSRAGATRYATVRFGNVLGSTGSVVPLFKRQLERGGPLTVTHPDMVRYFMTIREAVELVIQAASLGARLEDRRDAVFVLDMGKPVRIVDLAMQMIRLSGLKPGKDVEISFTGLRPGEKLFEELFYDSEKVQRTDAPGILIASVRGCDEKALQTALNTLAEACARGQHEEAVALLKSLVPEFQTQQASAA